MKTKTDYKSILIEINILTIAIAIIAVAVYFFLVPSHTSISSMSGLGIVLSNFVPLPLSAITMILNVVLLIIGFFTCGKEFGLKTVYTSVMLPVFLGIFENIFPNTGSITNSQELDVLCYILVVSVGLSILFNRNASSGGLDIVAKIMNKYFHMELGKAMSLSGMCVALSAALVYDKKTVVLSVLGTYFNGIVLDHFIFDHNIKRRVCIITKKEEESNQGHGDFQSPALPTELSGQRGALNRIHVCQSIKFLETLFNRLILRQSAWLCLKFAQIIPDRCG